MSHSDAFLSAEAAYEHIDQYDDAGPRDALELSEEEQLEVALEQATRKLDTFERDMYAHVPLLPSHWSPRDVVISNQMVELQMDVQIAQEDLIRFLRRGRR